MYKCEEEGYNKLDLGARGYVQALHVDVSFSTIVGTTVQVKPACTCARHARAR
jgi:hypothetical protein